MVGSSQLESDISGENFFAKSSNALDTNILARVLQSVVQVWNELGDGSLVQHGTTHTLSNKNLVTLTEVSGSGSVSVGVGLLHSINRSHTSSNGLGDVSNVGNTSIGNTWNTKLIGELSHFVNCSTLRSTTGHHFLGDTDRSRTHTDSQTINTSSNQLGGLFSGDNITTNDLQVWEGALDPFDQVDLENGVTLGGVQNNNVQTSCNQLGQSLFISVKSTNSSTTEQLLALERFGSVREVQVLLQVGSGDHGNQVSFTVNNWKFTLLGLSQDLVSFTKRDSRLGGDDVGCHHLRNGICIDLVELDISGGDNSNKLSTNFTSFCKFSIITKRVEKVDKLTSHWERGETVFLTHSLDLTNRSGWRNDNRIVDETVLVLLDLSDHLSLFIRGTVVMDDTDTSQKGHVDGHVGLGDGIHRRRNERGLQSDFLGQLGLQIHNACREVNLTWQNKEIVVCETSVEL
ncbi:hypothetical protein OGAPHI_003906 [Ogataea philodendri]|uniref:Uncharacterized protein n=1 Tax=Ogataea philodendri TaxID=1378263 RepID=A0A9P8T4A0_9ASCO|nr:uncharacterized protein OGAPHI_003906 [Ogataea philodendri]KAH3665718.1 hypothetical protein OGAPHI_003906 [Ogataea philodendri]